MKTIWVTKKDIKSGRPGSRCYCPIAISLHRRFPNNRVSVGRQTAHVGLESATLPGKAQRFIMDFDDDRPVKPFRFSVTFL